MVKNMVAKCMDKHGVWERGSMTNLTDRRESCLTDLVAFFESITECGQRRITIYLDFHKVFDKVRCQRLLKTLGCQKVGAFMKLIEQGTKFSTELKLSV